MTLLNTSKSELKQLWQRNLPEEVECFEDIYKLFLELWESNQKVNLFSRKLDQKTVFIDHIIDCALGLPFFDDSQIVLDFGCGGGLPGAVLATCRPLKKLILFDKSNKKIHYLKKVCEKLNLNNATCLSEPNLNCFKEIDTLTSRAVASTAKIMRWMKDSLLHPNCYILLYKAKRESIEEEIKEIETNTCSIRIHPLKYPEGLKERHILEINFNLKDCNSHKKQISPFEA